MITWPLVPLIASFKGREGEISDLHLSREGPELWWRNSMVVKMWVCFDCAVTYSKSVCVCVCAQMLSIDERKEAKSRAETAPQCSVPNHCRGSLCLFHFSISSSVHVSTPAGAFLLIPYFQLISSLFF